MIITHGLISVMLKKIIKEHAFFTPQTITSRAPVSDQLVIHFTWRFTTQAHGFNFTVVIWSWSGLFSYNSCPGSNSSLLDFLSTSCACSGCRNNQIDNLFFNTQIT